eukprot:g88.t1
MILDTILTAIEEHANFMEGYNKMMSEFIGADIFVAQSVADRCKSQESHHKVFVVTMGTVASVVSSTIEDSTGVDPSKIADGMEAAYKEMMNGDYAKHPKIGSMVDAVANIVGYVDGSVKAAQKRVFPIDFFVVINMQATRRIQVVCRLRASIPSERGGHNDDDDTADDIVRVNRKNGSVDIADPSGLSLRPRPRPRRFPFDVGFDPSDTQKNVFEKIGIPMIENAMKGYNTTLFAYGQTGSGKTYTMLGTSGDYWRGTRRNAQNSWITSRQTRNSRTNASEGEALGLVPRMCKRVFEMMEQSKEFDVRISFMEIYNEKVRDLLRSSRTSRKPGGGPTAASASEDPYYLKVREHPRKGVYVEDLSSFAVSSYAEVMRLLRRGGLSRTTKSTRMNSRSSRSHAIFQIKIRYRSASPYSSLRRHKQQREGKYTKHTGARQSTINLVDLAGSERSRTAGMSDFDMSLTAQKRKVALRRETASINKSLSTLGDVINALVNREEIRKRRRRRRKGKGRGADDDGQASFSSNSSSSSSDEEEEEVVHSIPYRNATLTWLLKESLGGNSLTFILAAISPAIQCYGETLSTLKYVCRAKKIVNRAEVNLADVVDEASLVSQLRVEIAHLKKQLQHAASSDRRSRQDEKQEDGGAAATTTTTRAGDDDAAIRSTTLSLSSTSPPRFVARVSSRSRSKAEVLFPSSSSSPSSDPPNTPPALASFRRREMLQLDVDSLDEENVRLRQAVEEREKLIRQLRMPWREAREATISRLRAIAKEEEEEERGVVGGEEVLPSSFSTSDVEDDDAKTITTSSSRQNVDDDHTDGRIVLDAAAEAETAHSRRELLVVNRLLRGNADDDRYKQANASSSMIARIDGLLSMNKKKKKKTKRKTKTRRVANVLSTSSSSSSSLNLTTNTDAPSTPFRPTLVRLATGDRFSLNATHTRIGTSKASLWQHLELDGVAGILPEHAVVETNATDRSVRIFSAPDAPVFVNGRTIADALEPTEVRDGQRVALGTRANVFVVELASSSPSPSEKESGEGNEEAEHGGLDGKGDSSPLSFSEGSHDSHHRQDMAEPSVVEVENGGGAADRVDRRRLTDENESLRRRLRKLEQQRATARARMHMMIPRLRDELARVKGSLATERARSARLRREHDDELAGKTSELARIKSQLDDERVLVRRLRRELDTSNGELEKACAKMRDGRRTEEETSELARVKSQLGDEGARGEIDDLKQVRTVLGGEVACLAEETGELRAKARVRKGGEKEEEKGPPVRREGTQALLG